MRIVVVLLGFGYFSFGQFQNPCGIASTFSNYSQAISEVRSATFSYSERINTDQSDWIRSAEYYSCDSQMGFLIIATESKESVHKNVPIGVWEAFKNAQGKGSFYNQAIKGEFKLELTTP